MQCFLDHTKGKIWSNENGTSKTIISLLWFCIYKLKNMYFCFASVCVCVCVCVWKRDIMEHVHDLGKQNIWGQNIRYRWFIFSVIILQSNKDFFLVHYEWILFRRLLGHGWGSEVDLLLGQLGQRRGQHCGQSRLPSTLWIHPTFERKVAKIL